MITKDYRENVHSFGSWCQGNYLVFKEGKTKEIVIHLIKTRDDGQALSNLNEKVETVSEYKYLGTFIDNKLFVSIHNHP